MDFNMRFTMQQRPSNEPRGASPLPRNHGRISKKNSAAGCHSGLTRAPEMLSTCIHRMIGSLSEICCRTMAFVRPRTRQERTQSYDIASDFRLQFISERDEFAR